MHPYHSVLLAEELLRMHIPVFHTTRKMIYPEKIFDSREDAPHFTFIKSLNSCKCLPACRIIQIGSRSTFSPRAARSKLSFFNFGKSILNISDSQNGKNIELESLLL